MLHIRVRAVDIGSFSVALLKLMSLAAASNARTHRAAADNRSPRENPSGVREKLSFAVSGYTAHLGL
jgi:hypothetical protein